MGGDAAWLDAVGQAELVRSGRADPEELLAAALERIDRLNPRLNAVVSRWDDKARRQAKAAPDGPFRGVPMLLKDGLAESAGDPRYEGARVLRDAGWRDKSDSTFVARLKAAGFVVCGKTNLSELATSAITRTAGFGAARNPWDLERTPGGSSGGSAAAVASGMVPVASGSDMGGSIRGPASCCGLVGLKPTRGRTSLGPALGEYWGGLATQHVLARTMRDTAALLDVVAGPDLGDPYYAPPPPRPFAAEVGAPTGRLRIGLRLSRPDGGGQPAPECAAAARSAARVLESLGHAVGEVEARELEDRDAQNAARRAIAAGVAHDFERWGSRLGRAIEEREVETRTWTLAELGRSVTTMQYISAIETMHAYSRRVASLFETIDVLVTPTFPQLPPRLDERVGDDKAFLREDRPGTLSAYTAPFNVTGQPAISLPLHWTTEGIPVGVQLVAAYAREDVLIRLGAQLEEATGWPARRPPVCA